MTIVLALLGLVLGGAGAGLGGAIAGAALGYAIGIHLQMRSRLESLDAAIERLERVERQRAFEGRKPEPRVAPVYEKDTPSPVPAAASVQPSVVRPAPPDPWRQDAAPPPEPAAADELSGEPKLPPALLHPPRRYAVEEEMPRLFQWIRDWFLGGNLVVRVGVVVLFIGVGFLLKLAVDRDMLPIEFRLAGAALGGAALLVIGWRLRSRLRTYALALQGGGVGLLYLTAFAALRFYDLLPPTATFAMLVAVAAFSAFLAIGQDALVLAALGALGGYLAPILTSTGQGDHVVLFGYYALLDAGVVAIAWFKAWRPLNLQAFVFTYGIGTAWGVLRYAPEFFASTEPFVVLFFFMFLAVAVLFARRTAPGLTHYVDATLVFGTPVMTMLLQSALVRGRPYGMAFSALALGAVYLPLTRVVWRRGGERLRLLAESFLALGVAFVTLAVPLALDGHWTAGTWALEGAAIFWVGLRQGRGLAIASGLLLQLGAAFSYALGHDVTPVHLPLANSECVGALLISMGGLATARVAYGHREKLPADYAWLVAAPFYWALGWWSFAGLNEIFEFLPARHRLGAVLGFATLTALVCAALSRRSEWAVARAPPLLLLPIMVASSVVAIGHDGHLLVNAGWAAWPLAFAAWFWLLWSRRTLEQPAPEPALHLITCFFVVAMVAVEITWQVEGLHLGDPAWHRVVGGVVPALALAVLLAPRTRDRWPARAYPGVYTGAVAGGLAAWLWSWTLAMCFDDAGARPLPYLPIVNPVELTQAFALVAVANWLLFLWRHAPRDWLPDQARRAVLAGYVLALFAVLNAVLLRVIHHVVDIAYTPVALLASTLVQAALSIFWGVLALGAMVVGTRRSLRLVWFTGGWLLGIVLAKMFLVDLSRTGTVSRIVSFIGVGVLMLIIGRFSPAPPADAAAVDPEKAR